jgi:hypothetical protein
MQGLIAKPLTLVLSRHREERSDEAIPRLRPAQRLDGFALARHDGLA